MYMRIDGLSTNAYGAIIADCGESIFYECVFDLDCYHVSVSTNAIIKINDDTVYFDIGGRKTSIKRNEFFTITIC